MLPHLKELDQYSRSLNRRRKAGLAMGMAVAAALFLLLVAAWDHGVDPIRETTAAGLVFALIPVLFGTGLFLFHRYQSRHRLGLRRIAHRIERAHPDLNDRLVTAAHILRTKPDGANILEEHVLDEARTGLRQIDWRRLATRWYEQPRFLGAALLVTVLLVFLAAGSVPVRKAGAHLGEHLGGGEPGLVVTTARPEVPRGSDYAVQLAVHRWEKEARFHYRENGQWRAEPVVLDREGKGSFTLYGLEETTAWFVTTPSLQSDEAVVRVFDPPDLEELQVVIDPPRYTGLPRRSTEGLGDWEVVEGSLLRFEAKAPAAEEGTIRLGDAEEAMRSEGNGAFIHLVEARETTDLRLLFADASGRQYETPLARLTVLPDEAPVLEILQPEKDLALPPDGVLPVEVFAADDYGLASARLRLRISGREAGAVELPVDGTPREWTHEDGLPLESLEVEDGDILSLYLEAEDNREPEPNRAATDLRFIEIRTPKPPEEMQGMPMEQQQIDLRALIAEQKRILRESHRAMALRGRERDELLAQSSAGMTELVKAIEETLAEVEPMLGGEGGEAARKLFSIAIERDTLAAGFLESGDVGDSLEPQGIAMSALLRLENALRRNIRSQSESESESSQSGSGQGQSGEQQEQQQRPEDAGPSMAEVAQELQELLQEQNALNRRFAEARQSDWSEATAREAAAQQRQLSARTRNLERSLQGLPDSGDLRAPLDRARRQMNEASAAANNRDAGSAQRSGLRARESLRAGAAALEAMAREAANRALTGAANRAGRLSEQQAAAAGQSEAAAAGESGAPGLSEQEANQRGLRQQYEELLQQMRRQAQQLAERDPAVAEALRDAARTASQSGTGGGMERAANALLYGQPGRASGIQSEAAQDLRGLAQSLRDAAGDIASDPARQAARAARELNQTLEELASYARDPELAEEGRLEGIREEWAEELRQLQQMTGNRRFGSQARALGGPLRGEWSGDLSATRAILGQAAMELQRILDAAGTSNRLQLNREAAPPPEEYRRQVESYFRRLADEPAQP